MRGPRPSRGVVPGNWPGGPGATGAEEQVKVAADAVTFRKSPKCASWTCRLVPRGDYCSVPGFGLNSHLPTSKSTCTQKTISSVGMRVWGVMSHKAACAIDSVQGVWEGHRHTKYKRQLSGQSVQTHIHSILHRPNLGLLMAYLILV